MENEFIELNLDSVEVANAIRALGIDNGYIFNMTQVQKLLYIAYGLQLSKYNSRLTKERPHAWPFGPVFPRVHKKVNFSLTPKEISLTINTVLRDFLNVLAKSLGKIPASKLTAWSHIEGSPWDKAKGDKWGKALSDLEIQEYFKNIKSVG